jgi:hypothetical protein
MIHRDLRRVGDGGTAASAEGSRVGCLDARYFCSIEV